VNSPAQPHPESRDAAQLAASRATALHGWNGRDPVWVFGYASLIWRPQLRFDERVAARVHGYHRQLCLWSVQHRGSPERPGLVAGLDRGGSCTGIAFRIPARHVEAEFDQLWQREMSLDEYRAHWLHCRRLAGGAPLRALGFVVRHASPYFSGRLPEADQVEIVVRAHGRYGSNLEYLEQTVAALRAEGLHDRRFERLAHQARAAMRAAGATG